MTVVLILALIKDKAGNILYIFLTNSMQSLSVPPGWLKPEHTIRKQPP